MASDTITILSTGSLPAALSDRLAGSGLHIDMVPFIHTASCIQEPERALIRQKAVRVQAVVFTSVAAVAAVAEVLKEEDRVAPQWELYCIGGATAGAAAAFFGATSMRAVAPDSALLSEEIIANGETAVLFFCGDRRLDTLPLTLSRSGIAVEELVTYTTVLTPQTLARTYDALLFFSPSAAESFFSANTVVGTTVLFAIGATTAAALAQYTGNEIITAALPSKEATVASVLDYFKK